MSCIEYHSGKIVPVRNLGYLIKKLGKVGASAALVAPSADPNWQAVLTVKYRDGSYHQSTWASRAVLENWLATRRDFRAVPVTIATEQPAIQRVNFRFWRGDVIAIFPDDPADLSGHVNSYMHIGQHGGASYSLVMADSRPASPAEFAALRAELESAPYFYCLIVIEGGE